MRLKSELYKKEQDDINQNIDVQMKRPVKKYKKKLKLPK